MPAKLWGSVLLGKCDSGFEGQRFDIIFQGKWFIIKGCPNFIVDSDKHKISQERFTLSQATIISCQENGNYLWYDIRHICLFMSNFY